MNMCLWCPECRSYRPFGTGDNVCDKGHEGVVTVYFETELLSLLRDISFWIRRGVLGE